MTVFGRIFVLTLALSAYACAASDKLEIKVVAKEPSGGTMQCADQLKISSPKFKTLILKSDYAADVYVPFITRQIELEKNRFLLIGWSSTGGGMVTCHAMVVERRDRTISLKSHLQMTTDRASGALVIQSDKDVRRVGLPLPSADSVMIDEWELSIDGQSVKGSDFKKRRPETIAITKDVITFIPPFAKRADSYSLSWITIADGRFSLQPKAKEDTDRKR